MKVRRADFYASREARQHLRAAKHYRDAAHIAAKAGADNRVVRKIRELVTVNATAAVAAARRTKAMHTHADSEIGEVRFGPAGPKLASPASSPGEEARDGSAAACFAA